MAKPPKRGVPAHEPAGVGRRQVLQGLLAGAGAGLAVPGVSEAHPIAGHARRPERIEAARAAAGREDGAAELLDASSMEMLGSLAERIVPGAGDAGCARFIDSLLAAGDPEHARRFLTALGAIDAEGRRRFGKRWSDLDEAQQVALLEAASSAEPGRPEVPPWEPGTSVADYLAAERERASGPAPVTLRDHFDEVRGWVVGAYYSSELGMWELGYTGMSFGATFKPCSHPDGHRGA